jgi:hypothetical protein
LSRVRVFPEDRVVELYPATHPHLDHGYAVTSHSSQGQTAEAIPCISRKTGKFADCSTQFLHMTKIAYYLLLKESDAKFFSPAQDDNSKKLRCAQVGKNIRAIKNCR